MKATMEFDELRFELQARQLSARVIMRIDPINDLASIANDLPNHIALEGVRFTKRMLSTRLGFVLQRTSIGPLTHVERSSVRPTKYIDVVSPRDRAQIGINTCPVSFKLHDAPNLDDPNFANTAVAVSPRPYQVSCRCDC